MKFQASDLKEAISAWETYANEEPDEVIRLLREPIYFMVLGKRFLPIRHLIAWMDGVGFSEKNARSTSMANHFETLSQLGFAIVREDSCFFAAVFEDWTNACLATGKPIANRINPAPRRRRVFVIAPSAF